MGFCAWSSAREPDQVFTLLETVYNAFDKIAESLGIFKGTVDCDLFLSVNSPNDVGLRSGNDWRLVSGKCIPEARVSHVSCSSLCSYVACCGLPVPRSDHAVAIAQFAIVCVKEMNRIVTALEPHLGPGTGDLRIRVGLHSGPVT